MRFCIYNTYEVFNHRNALFSPASYNLGEGLEKPFVALKNELASLGHSLDTIDCRRLEEFDAFLFLDFPDKARNLLDRLREMGKQMYLVVLECELLKPSNLDIRNLSYFDRIFTYNPPRDNTGRFIDSRIPYEFGSSPGAERSPESRSFLVAISSNKTSKASGELYSERLRAIRWFESHHPKDFDLYGRGWDVRTFSGNRAARALNRVRFLRRLFVERRPSFRGEVERKIAVLSRYKYCLCYENASILGYVTEKVFDCFAAGCVPVYLGAPDIDRYLPAESYVDKREYSTYEDLYNKLISIDEEEYTHKRIAIANFVRDFSGSDFASSAFARRVSGVLLADYRGG